MNVSGSEGESRNANALVAGSNPDPGMGTFFAWLCALFLGSTGSCFLFIGVSHFLNDPSLGTLLMMWVMGVWPLWIAGVAGWQAAVHARGGRVRFPSRMSTPFLAVNLVVWLPVLVASSWLSSSLIKSAFQHPWSLSLVLAFFVIVPPVLFVRFGAGRVVADAVSAIRSDRGKPPAGDGDRGPQKALPSADSSPGGKAGNRPACGEEAGR